MKTLAFGASGSKSSINQIFAAFTGQKLSNELKIVSLFDFPLPLFTIDEEKTNGIPENAKKFHEIIKNHDFIVISLAEHNGSYTAFFKNLFDWLSRIELKFFNEKN